MRDDAFKSCFADACAGDERGVHLKAQTLTSRCSGWGGCSLYDQEYDRSQQVGACECIKKDKAGEKAPPLQGFFTTIL